MEVYETKQLSPDWALIWLTINTVIIVAYEGCDAIVLLEQSHKSETKMLFSEIFEK